MAFATRYILITSLNVKIVASKIFLFAVVIDYICFDFVVLGSFSYQCLNIEDVYLRIYINYILHLIFIYYYICLPQEIKSG